MSSGWWLVGVRLVSALLKVRRRATAEVVVTADQQTQQVIHRSDQFVHRSGVGRLKWSDQTPPYAEFFCTVVYIPSKNIFPKVRSPNMALTCGFIYCDVVHICKTRNALNFLPYI